MVPYRSAPSAVLARFSLRSYPSYITGIGVSVVAVLLVFMCLRATGRLGEPAGWAAMLAVAAVPIWIVQRMPDYRIAGGAGEIRLFRDRVEIPHPDSREPIRMPLSEIRIQVPTCTYWMNGARIRESQSLILSTRTHQRVLASEVFAGSDDVLRVATAIRRLQCGLELEFNVHELPPSDGAEAHAFPRELAQH